MTETFTTEELHEDFLEPGEIPNQDEDASEPDAKFIKDKGRTVRARKYQQSSRTILNTVLRQVIAHESTVPDAAAIIMYGPDFCEKLGDLADHDAKVRRAIDFFMDGAENPYLAFAMVGVPFIAQIYRNHENQLQPKVIVQNVKARRANAKDKPGRKFKLFGREFTFRFRFHAPQIENITADPDALANHVFTNPAIVAGLQKAGIEKVAFNGHAAPQSSRKR